MPMDVYMFFFLGGGGFLQKQLFHISDIYRFGIMMLADKTLPFLYSWEERKRNELFTRLLFLF